MNIPIRLIEFPRKPVLGVQLVKAIGIPIPHADFITIIDYLNEKVHQTTC